MSSPAAWALRAAASCAPRAARPWLAERAGRTPARVTKSSMRSPGIMHSRNGSRVSFCPGRLRNRALLAAVGGRKGVRGRYRVRRRSRTRGPPRGGTAERGAQIARVGVSQAQQSCRASIAAAVALSLAVQPRLRVRQNPPRRPPSGLRGASAEMARETRRHSPQEGGGVALGCLPPIQCAQRGACHALGPRDTCCFLAVKKKVNPCVSSISRARITVSSHYLEQSSSCSTKPLFAHEI